jgi:hypothetical protein
LGDGEIFSSAKTIRQDQAKSCHPIIHRVIASIDVR